jgi:hypothetical protein
MSNMRHIIEGVLVEPPIDLVNSKLVNDGDTLLICAWNGTELYIRENGINRTSTMVEWKNYWKKKK